MEHVYDTLIIGGGPAGYTAALYASRAGLDTAVVEKLSPGGQMTMTGVIDNYPGFEQGIEGFELGMKMQACGERFGAKTHYAEVISVNLSGKVKELITTDGSLYAKTVIIASGANPRELGLEREQSFMGMGVHYCAHCDGRFYKDKVVAVVGGGNSAVTDALYLSRMAKKVYLIHRRDSLRADKIYHAPLEKCSNVEFVWNTTVTELIGENRLSSIRVKTNGNEAIIDCDAVFVSIGRKPITDFLGDEISTDKNGYIIAGESTETNIDGVYAAGDVRTKALRQIVTAVADGAVSVHFAQEYIDKFE